MLECNACNSDSNFVFQRFMFGDIHNYRWHGIRISLVKSRYESWKNQQLNIYNNETNVEVKVCVKRMEGDANEETTL